MRREGLARLVSGRVRVQGHEREAEGASARSGAGGVFPHSAKEGTPAAASANASSGASVTASGLASSAPAVAKMPNRLGPAVPWGLSSGPPPM